MNIAQGRVDLNFQLRTISLKMAGKSEALQYSKGHLFKAKVSKMKKGLIHMSLSFDPGLIVLYLRNV